MVLNQLALYRERYPKQGNKKVINHNANTGSDL